MKLEPVHPSSTRRRELPLLCGLTLAALAVRLLFLGRAQLWGDEILFVVRDGHPAVSIAEIYQHMLNGFSSVTHLPFPLIVHNLAIRLLSSIFGIQLNPFWFRIPAALWGTATVPALFLLLRQRLSRPVVWLATAWVAVGFFPVYYSREAYFYAPLMALAAFTLHFWLCGIEALSCGKRLPKRAMLGLMLAGTAMVHSHLIGLLMQTVLCAGALTAAGLPRHSRWRIPGACRLAALSAVPLLMASPFLYVGLAGRVQSSMAPGTPVWQIVLDVAGKYFLGHMALLNAAGLLVMGLGLFALARAGAPDHPAPRWMAGIAAVLFILLVFLANRTAYHARYFAVMIPLLFTINACGVVRFSEMAGRTPLLRRIPAAIWFRMVAGGLLALNLLILPLFWLPTVRARDYAAVADWLNQTLPPGSAYLWESAFERRFVSEDENAPFPTPQRLAMWPMVHSGPAGIPALRLEQQKLLERYPDVPWIDCRHGHRNGMTFGDWEWPQRSFRQLVMIGNASFDLQERFRIGVNLFGLSPLNEKTIPIRYNSPADILAMDREAGRPGSLFYPDWFFDVIYATQQSQEYARTHVGSNAPLQAVSLQDKAIPAMLEAGIAVTARHAGQIRLELLLGAEAIGSWVLPAGRHYHPIRSDPFFLPPGSCALELRADPGPSNEIQAIWLQYAEIEAPRRAGGLAGTSGTRGPQPPTPSSVNSKDRVNQFSGQETRGGP